jgi:uncharacterized protein (TIGR01777 family)
MRSIVIIGASGFLGRATAEHFLVRGASVHLISRRDPGLEGATFSAWDGETLGAWVNQLNGATAVINFAGRSVNCRYHRRHREEILQSRVRTTQLLGEAIQRCVLPPRVWLNASTATIYRHAEDRPMGEANGEAGSGFSVEVAQAWENALFAARTPNTIKTALRTSMVLGWGTNSVYPVLRDLVRMGLGGRQGNGRQRVSWIHERDFCRALEFLIDRPQEGPINLAAPDVLPNRDLMATMRQHLGRPFGLPAPAWLLALGAVLLRTETELVLKSRWIASERLLASGFRFRVPTFVDALLELESERQALLLKPVLGRRVFLQKRALGFDAPDRNELISRLKDGGRAGID